MRIAVDARSLLTACPRGEGRTLKRLYEHIALLRPGWEICLYGEHVADSGIAARNVSSRVLTVPGFRFNLWENLGLPLHAKFAGADLLHSTSSSTPRIPLVPTVMTVHDVIPLIVDDGLSQPAVERFRSQLEFGLRRARAVIAVSENTKADLISLFNLDPAKITVVYWGADKPCVENPVAPTHHGGLADLGISGPYVVAFAGEARRKNTEAIIRAFSEINTNGPYLVLVGLNNPSGRKRFGELAYKLHCGDRVKILDYVADDVLEIVLQGAMALLYVSLYEGFGLPLLEAMARGVPIIASNVSSIPEIAGNAALLVTPSSAKEIGAALEEVLSRPVFRNELIERGFERLKAFRWDTAAERTITIFESVAGRDRMAAN